jgi:hypothetical protein
MDLRAGGVEHCSRFLRTGEAYDFVAVSEELWNYRRTNMSGCSGDEYAHLVTSRVAIYSSRPQ